MRKKAQGNAAAIVLVVIVLLIVLGMILVLLFYPSISGLDFKYKKFNENEDKNQVKNQVYEITCTSPYIKVGAECCLDKNYNSICDRDEKAVVEEATCSFPYIKKGTACCLDEDRTGICDENEVYHTGYRIRRGHIDDPFKISHLELYRDTITIELKNDEDYDLIIKLIDIDDCGSESFDKEIEAGKKRTFHIDCDDDLRRIDSDLEVRYKKINSNVTLTADGDIEIDKRTYLSREDNYY